MPVYAINDTDAKMAITTMVTSSSTIVNPVCRKALMFLIIKYDKIFSKYDDEHQRKTEVKRPLFFLVHLVELHWHDLITDMHRVKDLMTRLPL